VNSIKKNLGNFLIIIIGSAAALFINNNAENSLNIESSVIKTTPDNLFNKVKYIAMDTNGVPLYTVSSPVMRQFFDNEVIEAESPNILLFRKDKPPTKITSNFGKIAYKRHNIKLSGDVNMYFKENLSEPFLKLNTDEIYIYLDEQLAVTDSEVFIKKNNSYLNGKGMKSSLIKGEFVIFENTRGRHVR
jgi:LPS export ABC transporter protein LptC